MRPEAGRGRRAALERARILAEGLVEAVGREAPMTIREETEELERRMLSPRAALVAETRGRERSRSRAPSAPTTSATVTE